MINLFIQFVILGNFNNLFENCSFLILQRIVKKIELEIAFWKKRRRKDKTADPL